MSISISPNQPVSAPPPVRQQEARPAVDKPVEQVAPPAPQPVINTSGQVTGTRINTAA